MRSLVRWALAAAVVAAVAGGATAQRPGGGQPGGGGGQFGGGGGIFLGGTNVKSLLVSNTALQDELKVTDEQKKALKEFTDTQAEEAKKLPAFGGDEEQQLERAKANVKLLEERIAFHKKTLTATQAKRIAQLEKQVMGLAAFSNEKVAAELKLTAEQKDKIKEVSGELQKEQQEMFRGAFGGGGTGGRFDPEKMAEVQKKVKGLQEEAFEKVEKTLTAEQKSAWKEMVGDPFDTAKLVPQRPGRNMN